MGQGRSVVGGDDILVLRVRRFPARPCGNETVKDLSRVVEDDECWKNGADTGSSFCSATISLRTIAAKSRRPSYSVTMYFSITSHAAKANGSDRGTRSHSLSYKLKKKITDDRYNTQNNKQGIVFFFVYLSG